MSKKSSNIDFSAGIYSSLKNSVQGIDAAMDAAQKQQEEQKAAPAAPESVAVEPAPSNGAVLEQLSRHFHRYTPKSGKTTGIQIPTEINNLLRAMSSVSNPKVTKIDILCNLILDAAKGSEEQLKAKYLESIDL